VRIDLGYRFASLGGSAVHATSSARAFLLITCGAVQKGAQECAAMRLAIGKTRLQGDDVDRMAALLHHQAGGLDTKVSTAWPAIGPVSARNAR